MRFGLIANLKRIGANNAITALVDWAREGNYELLLCEDLRETCPNHDRFVTCPGLASQVDLLVSMGGDGTLLATARSVGASGTPILGINLGSLGFLTQFTPAQLIPSLNKIVKGSYNIEERMLLKAELVEGDKLEQPFALNDIVLHAGPVTRLLDINLSVNGEKAVTYHADGLILSTPTGSTAYNLAVGGPILHPRLEAIIAAPISPFSLTTRPMIFPPDSVMEVTIGSDDREAILSLDGQVMVPIHSRQKIRISPADFRIKFVTFPENSYYRLLESKLHWGKPPNYVD